MSQNVATSISSLTSQSCGDSLPAVCLPRLPKHPWTSDMLKNKASVKADHQTLAMVYT